MTEENSKQERIMDEAEFLQVTERLSQRIIGNGAVKQEDRSCALKVLRAIVVSVKAHGARQHGITKKMLQRALPVFGKMSEEKNNSEEEQAALKMLVMVTLEGIRQN